MRVYLESYGCAQSHGEGSGIARDLADRGHEILSAPGAADVGVLVTCGVIGSTEARMVRRWRALGERLPRMVVTGCLVPLRTGLFDGPVRDRTIFLPIREQHRLAELLGPAAPSPPTAPGSRAEPRVATEVVIAQGCTSACSYCYSRLARGHLTSVSSLEVAGRVESAHRRGATEIRLTSLDTSAWGIDLPTGERFPALLDAVAGVEGDFDVRVGMMSPQTLAPIRDDYLRALLPDRFYRFLHLPVQSGSDGVLDRMRRGYTARGFRELVAAARRSFPDLHLATDVIVGFPGETNEEFRATVDLLEEVAPETLNVTRFSARPGTPSSHLAPVPASVVKERSRTLARARPAVARRTLERWIGSRRTARVAEYGPGGSSVVRLPNYLPVVVSSRPPLGARVEVRVDGARSTYLLGHVVAGPAF